MELTHYKCEIITIKLLFALISGNLIKQRKKRLKTRVLTAVMKYPRLNWTVQNVKTPYRTVLLRWVTPYRTVVVGDYFSGIFGSLRQSYRNYSGHHRKRSNELRAVLREISQIFKSSEIIVRKQRSDNPDNHWKSYIFRYFRISEI